MLTLALKSNMTVNNKIIIKNKTNTVTIIFYV